MGIICIKQKTNTCGREIFFSCDHCGTMFKRNYKKRRTVSKTGFFCSDVCSGTWKMVNGITDKNLFSKENRKKSSISRKKRSDEDKKATVEKVKKTCLENWGVDNVSKSQTIKNKKIDTCKRNFGVSHQMRCKEISSKVFKTQLENRKNFPRFASQQEIMFGEILKKRFGEENIVQQIQLPIGIIDFYIKNIDTYVEFDGVYWHGLDRPKIEIENSVSARSKSILKRMEKDSKENFWFKDNRLKLVRITDREFKKMIKERKENEMFSLLFGE